MSMSFICSTFNSPPPSPVLKLLHLVFQLGMKRFNQPRCFQPTVFEIWNVATTTFASPKKNGKLMKVSWKLPWVGRKKSPHHQTPPLFRRCLCRPVQGWLRFAVWWGCGQQLGADGFLKILPIQVFFVPQKKKTKNINHGNLSKIWWYFWYYHDIYPFIKVPPPPVPSTLLAAPEGSSLNLRYLVLWWTTTRCFLKWWVLPPIFIPEVLIIFSRKTPWVCWGNPPFSGHPHMIAGWV